MNNNQALQAFWSQFDLPAYDENSVPSETPLPYLTHETVTGQLDEQLAVSASIWYRTASWTELVEKTEEIETIIGRGGVVIPTDSGAIWVKRGSPWTRRSTDEEDDSVKRVIFNITLEYIQ